MDSKLMNDTVRKPVQPPKRGTLSEKTPGMEAGRSSGRKMPAESGKKAKKKVQRKNPDEKIKYYGEIGQWFQTLCWMKIPVVGFFYMLVKAISKKTPAQKKSFAIAYILYRILVLLLALTILFVLYRVGLSFIDEILRYAGGVL